MVWIRINIFLSPAWLVSREADNPYNAKTREIVKEFDYLNIPVGEGNVIFPQGNAVKYLGEYFDTSTEYTNPYEEDPKDIRTLSKIEEEYKQLMEQIERYRAILASEKLVCDIIRDELIEMKNKYSIKHLSDYL